MITDWQAGMEKKAGLEDFQRMASRKAVQWVPRQVRSGNASSFNCLSEIHVVHWCIKVSESSVKINWLNFV